ncbi:hypothetical protein quinque_001966 [Culex quinquefasciatus]
MVSENGGQKQRELEEDPNVCKERGNEEFKNGFWDEALVWYTKAIKNGEKHKDLPVFYKNRAATYLKLENYTKALDDCTKSLEGCPNDPKALFRRFQALEGLERFEESYRDLRAIHTQDPNNKTIKPHLERMHAIVQERSRQRAQTSNKVTQMFQIAFDLAAAKEKREQAMNNIVVLARETAGAEVMMKEGLVHQIGKLLKVEKNNDIVTNAIRAIDQVCTKSEDRTKTVIKELGIPWFLQILDSNLEDRVSVAQHCMQTVLNSCTGMENKDDSKPVKELVEGNKQLIDTLLTCLVYSITERTITGFARDAIMELIIRNVHYKTIDWAERLVEMKGLFRLMEVCSELEEYKYESAMNITPSSRTIATVCLARIYENMYYDAARQRFLEQIEDFVKDKLLTPDHESKVRVTVALTSLLTGPLDVGNSMLSKEGVLQMILAMAQSDVLLEQKVAVECIIAAASKKDKAKGLAQSGAEILKKLYTCKNEEIRVRALVGLCKMGSVGGLDASIRPFADGSTKKLAEACRKFLVKPGKDKDVRKFAAEGLSYLTLDADVKEKLIEDRAAIQGLIELAKTGDQSALYGVVTTLVNLVNAYEKQEILPELVELAKFAKHHIPEEHELDDPDFVSGRIIVLANEGVTSGLVALCKTESENSKEMIARVFNALCSEQEVRGKVVQQGGAKDCNSLENFEALMALCNLASMNESTRQRIIKEQGISKVETYMAEDHLMLQRAATQVMCNMVQSPEVVKMHEKENDRVKFLALLTMEEDEETALASSGALAYLTAVSEKCCEKMFSPNSWMEIFQTLIANPCPEVQYRGMVIVLNVISANKTLAERICDTELLRMIYGATQLNDEKRAKGDRNGPQDPQGLIELAKTGDQSALYGVVTTLVNLVNAYEKQEILPELVELAKFAKHHIPEEHELDDPDFVSGRIIVLANEGVTSGLVALCKTESENSKEMIARVFNALCSEQEVRGKVVQQGGAKVLLPLSLNGTANGKRHAAQALSRIGITINPEVAFPGQRNLEVVRPLLNQLHPDCNSSKISEALMALCNLASMNESTRQRIIKEQGISKVETYMAEDHLMLQRAATQVMCNMVQSPEVVKMHEKENDRVKFLALLTMEEDEETALASSGALAYLTAVSEKCCEKMFSPNSWMEIFQTLIANPCPEVQYRGMVIVLNVISANKTLAERICDTELLRMIYGATQLNDEKRAKAIETAHKILKVAEENRLIEENKDADLAPDVFKEQSATIEEIDE